MSIIQEDVPFTLRDLKLLIKETKKYHGKGSSGKNKKQLLEIYHQLARKQGGAGIIKDAWEKIKSVGYSIGKKLKELLFFPSNRLSNKASNVLKKYANKNIQRIIIQRAPLVSPINIFLNVISLGQLQKKIKSLGYDNIFHLSMLVTIDGNELTIEKNEKINIQEGDNAPINDRQTMEVYIDREITLDELLYKTKEFMGEHDFYQYNSKTNNCQDFLLGILSANGLLNNELTSFIKQNAEEIFESLPNWMSSLSQLITDTYAKIGEFKGDGKPKRKSKRKPKRKPKH